MGGSYIWFQIQKLIVCRYEIFSRELKSSLRKVKHFLWSLYKNSFLIGNLTERYWKGGTGNWIIKLKKNFNTIISNYYSKSIHCDLVICCALYVYYVLRTWSIIFFNAIHYNTTVTLAASNPNIVSYTGSF